MGERIEVTSNQRRVDTTRVLKHLQTGGSAVFEPVSEEAVEAIVKPKPVIDRPPLRRSAASEFDRTVVGRAIK